MGFERLISTGADQTIRIWDAESRLELTTLRGHLSEVNSASVVDNGGMLISGCKDGTIFGWDLKALNHAGPFESLPHPVEELIFRPNGGELLSVDKGRGVSVWDAETLESKGRLMELDAGASRLLFAPDGKTLYAAEWGRGITVMDWDRRVVTANLLASARAFPICFLDEGKTLVAADDRSTFHMIDTSTWETRFTRKFEEWDARTWMEAVPVPGESSLIVPERGGGGVKLDLLTGLANAFYDEQHWGIRGDAVHPEGNLLAAASGTGTIQIRDAGTLEALNEFRAHLLGVHGVAFSPDGKRLASASHGAEAVKLWDVETWQEVATLPGDGLIRGAARFSPDGRILSAINLDGKAHLWRAPSLKEIAEGEKPGL